MSTVHLDPLAARQRELARFVKSMAVAGGDPMGAEQYALARGWQSTAAVLKTIIAPNNQDDLDNGLAPVASALAAVLRPQTLIGRLQGMTPVPLRTRLLTQSAGGTGAWVLEGNPIPADDLSMAATYQLDAMRVGGIRLITQELMRAAEDGSDALVANDAAGGLADAMNLAFIDPANGGTTAKPASITYGAAATFSASGTSLAAVDADLQRLMNALTDAEMPLTTAAWIMAPRTATTLSLLRGSSGAPAYPGMTARGGQLLGLPVLTSTSVAASGSPGERFITLVEASDIALADEGAARIELSTTATLQMNDAPAAGDQQGRSLWQLGLVGIKGERLLNWKRRRSGSVAVLRDVTY